jgi:hypothetical protein
MSIMSQPCAPYIYRLPIRLLDEDYDFSRINFIFYQETLFFLNLPSVNLSSLQLVSSYAEQIGF